MQDIIIAGYSINQLKAQREAIRQDASKFISDNISKATTLVREVVENAGDYAVATKLAQQAGELLETINIVSSVSGVEYYLPYNEPYDGGNALSDELENVEDSSFKVYDNDAVGQLHDILITMEENSYLWNSSSVHC